MMGACYYLDDEDTLIDAAFNEWDYFSPNRVATRVILVPKEGTGFYYYRYGDTPLAIKIAPIEH